MKSDPACTKCHYPNKFLTICVLFASITRSQTSQLSGYKLDCLHKIIPKFCERVNEVGRFLFAQHTIYNYSQQADEAHITIKVFDHCIHNPVFLGYTRRHDLQTDVKYSDTSFFLQYQFLFTELKLRFLWKSKDLFRLLQGPGSFTSAQFLYSFIGATMA